MQRDDFFDRWSVVEMKDCCQSRDEVLAACAAIVDASEKPSVGALWQALGASGPTLSSRSAVSLDRPMLA